MKRVSWTGWLVAGLLLVQSAATGLAAPADGNPLGRRLLQRSDGTWYVFHAGLKFTVQAADIGDQVIDAIPPDGITEPMGRLVRCREQLGAGAFWRRQRAGRHAPDRDGAQLALRRAAGDARAGVAPGQPGGDTPPGGAFDCHTRDRCAVASSRCYNTARCDRSSSRPTPRPARRIRPIRWDWSRLPRTDG